MVGSSRDSGSMVVGWLVKLVVGIVLFAVCAFDAISVGAAHVSGADDADNAALAAADSWRTSHDLSAALAAARDAEGNDETILSTGFSVDADGTVHLVMEKTATTLVLSHLGPLKKYTVVRIKGESGPPA